MDSEVLHSLVLGALRWEPRTQFNHILAGVGRLAYERGIFRRPGHDPQSDGRGNLEQEDEEKVGEIIWELIVQGVIVPGMDSANPAWPFLRVTTYGQTVLKARGYVPHDPEGYLSEVRQRVGTLDPIVELYLLESLVCFRRAAFIACAVMLGVASEAAIRDLMRVAANGNERLLREIKCQPVATSFDSFRKRLSTVRGLLPREISDNLEIVLDGVFLFVRNTRNDAGHPTGRRMSREECFASLQQFKIYLERVTQLSRWIAENGMGTRDEA